MDRPITSCPCSASRAAATDESTPPDIATTIFIPKSRKQLAPRSCLCLCSNGCPGEAAELFHDTRQHTDHVIDIGLGVGAAETEANRVLCPMHGEAHGLQHVR